MSKKGKAPNPQLNASRETKPKVESKISISLEHLTLNKNYNFDFFGKNFRAKAQALENFIEFLILLTAKTPLEIISLPKEKNCGFEQIPFQQIKINPHGIELGQDTDITVFRFGAGNKYRLLGFFSIKEPVLNVIGFDFDFSAYEH